jgi:hypothetical protein
LRPPGGHLRADSWCWGHPRVSWGPSGGLRGRLRVSWGRQGRRGPSGPPGSPSDRWGSAEVTLGSLGVRRRVFGVTLGSLGVRQGVAGVALGSLGVRRGSSGPPGGFGSVGGSSGPPGSPLGSARPSRGRVTFIGRCGCFRAWLGAGDPWMASVIEPNLWRIRHLQIMFHVERSSRLHTRRERQSSPSARIGPPAYVRFMQISKRINDAAQADAQRLRNQTRPTPCFIVSIFGVFEPKTAPSAALNVICRIYTFMRQTHCCPTPRPGLAEPSSPETLTGRTRMPHSASSSRSPLAEHSPARQVSINI